MDEMTWTDPQLKARYEENSRKLERLKETLPNLYSEDALPYKVFTTNSVHGIQRMRLIWLKEHHPQRFREMMMANVLEEHLRDIETRTRERQAQIMDCLCSISCCGLGVVTFCWTSLSVWSLVSVPDGFRRRARAGCVCP